MTSIEVVNLQKTFQTKRKAAGLNGSMRALIKPEYSAIEAVRNLSFQMEAGELLGFIGTNGAGKSTTIKMLTGILHPSGGTAKVLGFTPWIERQKLAYQIGTVFGQRPQLWYHLPARRVLHQRDDIAIRLDICIDHFAGHCLSPRIDSANREWWIIHIMSLRGGCTSRRSNLQLYQRLLRAKNKSALATTWK